MTLSAYFLWIGGPIPDMARVSILSAAEAGFETVLFSDRDQQISHPALRKTDWREVAVPWAPEKVRLKDEDRPCYAAFSDLFRFALLAQNDGGWFDCDTIVLRDAAAFADLLRPGKLTVGRENVQVINGAVLGSEGRTQAQYLYEKALTAFPVLDTWGIVGPQLITRSIAEGAVDAHVCDQTHFYPVHHADIAQIYLPDECAGLQEKEQEWYCLSVWNEVLTRSGLAHLPPPPGSYLNALLARRPELGGITGDPTSLATYLAHNLRQLEEMDSGRVAMKTLARKAAAQISRWRTKRG